MKFLLSICAPPSSETAMQAYLVAKTILQQHQINQLFFYAEGVLNSRRWDNRLAEKWQTLINNHQLDAVCCANSAADHQLLDDGQERLPDFSIAGIAQLSTETIACDRCITFGTRPGSD